MTRVAFTADLHVDAYGSRVDPVSGLNARLVDYLRTVGFVAEEARARGAEALVVAGDITERRHANDWLLRLIQDRLSDGPRRQIFLRGNHDAEVAGESKVSVLAEMGGDWSSFGRPGHAVVGDVVLCLLPYLDRHWLRAQPGFESIPDAEVFGVLGEQFLAIAGGLYAQARQAYPDKAAVLVCHQTLAGASMSETQQAFLGDLSLVVDARALAAIGFEAVVAGHLHRHQIVVPGDRPILYPGSIERVDFGEEREAKGFIAADVGPGWFEWEFVATPARRFVTLRGDEATDIPAGIQLDGSIVRVLDLDPSLDPVAIRGHLETLGAFEVVEIRRRPTEAPESAGGLSESLSAEQALAAYFADEPDAEALVERGRAILAEAAA